MSGSLVTAKIELTEAQAQALAQLVKRIGWKELRDNSVDEDESYLMRDGVVALQRGLADAGFAPR